MALATAAYAVLGVARHRTFNSTGFDLGLFDQVLWHAGRFERPASSLKGLDWILGDHLSPALVLLVPAGWLGPEGLIVAQALVVCLAAFPIAAFARPRVGERGALALAGAYLLFGGVQEALLFDVHEVALAPLPIALAVLWADRGQLGRASAAVLFLLLVKEDLALLVIAFGALFAVLGHRRLGAALAAAGAVWFVLALAVVIPAFGEGAGYAYGRAAAPLEGLATKLRTGAYLLIAFGVVWLRSPIALLAAPLVGVRLLSAEPKHWTLEDHYTLTIAPVLALAAADALGRWREPLRACSEPGRRLRARRRPALLTRRLDRRGPLALLRRFDRLRPPALLRCLDPRRLPAALLVLAVLLAPAFGLADLVRPATYRVDPAYRGAEEVLARIPPGASVAATNRLIAHLARRDDVRLLGRDPPTAAWIAAAVADPDPEGSFPLPDAAAVARRVGDLPGYDEVARSAGGIVVLRRR